VKDSLKYIAYIILASAVIIVVLRFRACVNPATTEVFVSTPVDTSFSPVVKRDYRPKSTPFERPLKPAVKLPKNIRESDVKRVLIVVKSGRDIQSNVPAEDTTTVITTKDGNVHVAKQNGRVRSVELITYQPTILDFRLSVLLGVTLGKDVASPVVAIYPLQICGAIQIPILAADLHGFGAGVSYRWNNFSAGILLHYSAPWAHPLLAEFTADRQLKLMLAYNF